MENYPLYSGFGTAFTEVRDFLFRIQEEKDATPNFPWGRWEWMFSLPYLETNRLDRIGIWRSGKQIIGLATYESSFGDVYFCWDPDFPFIKREMLEYALVKMSGSQGPHVMIPDNDPGFQELARTQGLIPTDWKEHVAVLDITDRLSYSLPPGFSIVHLSERFDLCEYNRVLHRGFDHPGVEINDKDTILSRLTSLSGPDVRPELNTAVVSPEGHFVSYCGMWHRPGSKYCLVEPVATDPAFRRQGLGRAAVLEALRQCGKNGAIRAFVGSDQAFYYRIGFRPYCTETFWKKPNTSE